MSSETVFPFPESTLGSVRGSVQGQNSTFSRFPYLDMQKLSVLEKLALECKLLRDSDKIMSEFSDLTHYTIESIASRCVSVRERHTC